MRKFDIKYIRASDILGVIDSRALVKFAEDALVDPVDECLLDLSLCDPNDEDCILRAKMALYIKYNLHNMDKKSALRYYAKVTCERIVRGEIEPLEGSQEIAKATIWADINNFTELDPFIYIYSEFTDRPSDRDFFTRAARREAELLLERIN